MNEREIQKDERKGQIEVWKRKWALVWLVVTKRNYMDVTKLGLDAKCVQTETYTKIFLEDISYANNVFWDILIQNIFHLAKALH